MRFICFLNHWRKEIPVLKNSKRLIFKYNYCILLKLDILNYNLVLHGNKKGVKQSR